MSNHMKILTSDWKEVPKYLVSQYISEFYEMIKDEMKDEQMRDSFIKLKNPK